MQNKANFLDAQMNVSSILTTYYENKSNWTLGENKPKQTQSQVALLFVSHPPPFVLANDKNLLMKSSQKRPCKYKSEKATRKIL